MSIWGYFLDGMKIGIVQLYRGKPLRPIEKWMTCHRHNNPSKPNKKTLAVVAIFGDQNWQSQKKRGKQTKELLSWISPGTTTLCQRNAWDSPQVHSGILPTYPQKKNENFRSFPSSHLNQLRPRSLGRSVGVQIPP